MASNRETFTPETARHFDRYSVANAVAVKQSLPCGCEPYRDVFTYLRWKAQGFQVQRGEKAIKLPLIYGRTESDPETGEARTVRRVGRSAVFCRCQVKPIEARATRGNCPSCGGWGKFAGGRSCRRCDGTGSVAERAERYVIGRPIEETLCDWCGAPLYVGDVAIETDRGIYCSRACAAKVAS
jgi:hypothetical protein